MARCKLIERETKETNISLQLDLDGKGEANIDTGIGFMDHMLEGFAKHGFFDLKVKAKGDLNVDGHHTVEDLGIVLGIAIKETIGNKAGIKRYGSMILPMDDALVLCAIDLCGRPYFNYECTFSNERVGYLETQNIREFFYAISYSAGMNLHIKVLNGENDHHKIEAIFKAFAKALDEASSFEPRSNGVLSTKGTL
ncbi:MAG: imidazoleglycerol-phosphate dehydratase HisB [Lachnospiraceae bacterium]|nr:imidazoleglycerol-phosphate dehydratase HisB [Lachnospiraceae bacterium]